MAMMTLPFGADVVTFRGDGEQIMVGASNHYGETWQGALLLYKLDGDNFIEETRVDTYTGVTGCAYLDEKGMKIVSTHDDGGVHIWDNDGTHTTSLVGHTHAALCITVGLDEAKIATGGAEGVLRVWNVSEAEPVPVNFKGNSSKIQALAWGTIGLASGCADGSLNIWDVREREATHSFHLEGGLQEVSSLSWGDNGMLAVASEASTVLVYDPRMLEAPVDRLSNHSATVKHVAWAPGAVFPSTLCSVGDDSVVGLTTFDAADEGQQGTQAWHSSEGVTGKGHTDSITSAAWHPSQPKLVSVGWDCNLVCWTADEMS